MEEILEKFTIEITDRGMDILRAGQPPMRFTAVEALMLLDILKEEEVHLRRLAEAATSLPLKIRV